MKQTAIQRKHLITALLHNRNVTSVDVRQITLEPGQQTGRHLHPCTVVGYVVSGTASLKIEGQAAITLSEGSAFHEPAGAVITDFSNASSSDPMTFVAFYLLDGDQELITMLDK
jgi:quercetin dioxygenase-like cupin family protein